MSLLQAPSASHSPSRDQAHHRRCRCGLSLQTAMRTSWRCPPSGTCCNPGMGRAVMMLTQPAVLITQPRLAAAVQQNVCAAVQCWRGAVSMCVRVRVHKLASSAQLQGQHTQALTPLAAATSPAGQALSHLTTTLGVDLVGVTHVLAATAPGPSDGMCLSAGCHRTSAVSVCSWFGQHTVRTPNTS